MAEGQYVLRTRLDPSGIKAGFAEVRGETRRFEDQSKIAFRGVGAALGAIAASAGARAYVGFLRGAAEDANRAAIGLELFGKQLTLSNQSVSEGQRVLEGLGRELGLVPQLLADNATQLLRQGLTIEQVGTLFRGAASSALAAGKDAQAGIEAVTNAVVTQSSVYLNFAGIAENLDVAYRDYARTLGKTADELTKQEKAQAAVLLVQQATREEVATLPMLLSGVTGAQNRLTQAYTDFRLELGEAVAPAVTGITNALAGMLNAFNALPEPIKAAGGVLITSAGAVTALTVGFVSLNTIAGTLGITMTGLRLALLPLLGPAGILVGAAVLLGGIGAAWLSMGSDAKTAAERLDEAKEAIGSANDKASLAGALESLADHLEGDGKTALQDYAQEVRNAKGDLDDLKGAAAAAAAQFAAMPLLAERAKNEAEIAMLKSMTPSGEQQGFDPEQFRIETEERLTRQFGRFGAPITLEWKDFKGEMRLMPTPELDEALRFPGLDNDLQNAIVQAIFDAGQNFSGPTNNRVAELEARDAELSRQIAALDTQGAPSADFGARSPTAGTPPPKGTPDDPVTVKPTSPVTPVPVPEGAPTPGGISAVDVPAPPPGAEALQAWLDEFDRFNREFGQGRQALLDAAEFLRAQRLQASNFTGLRAQEGRVDVEQLRAIGQNAVEERARRAREQLDDFTVSLEQLSEAGREANRQQQATLEAQQLANRARAEEARRLRETGERGLANVTEAFGDENGPDTPTARARARQAENKSIMNDFGASLAALNEKSRRSAEVTERLARWEAVLAERRFTAGITLQGASRLTPQGIGGLSNSDIRLLAQQGLVNLGPEGISDETVSRFREAVEGSSDQFEKTIIQAGIGFAATLAQGIQSGNPGQVVSGLFGAAGSILSAIPGIGTAGAIIGGLLPVFGSLFGNSLGQQDEAERMREQARRDRARSVPALSISINQQNAFNYNGNPRDAGADLAMSRHAQTIAAQIADAIVPRLERLEQRVAAL